MKKILFLGLILAGFFISSCTRDVTQMEESDLHPEETIGKKGGGQFGSAEEFSEMVTSLKERNALDINLFSVNFSIGFSFNMAGGGFKYKNMSFSPAKNVSIIRG